ncbi:MAG TPA: PQQ-binding-like beta-propeller repeat protein [Gemmataceae bacterium]|nr:PQQ-binding-like beta-propeller repeat protein [Gemmataceae bacterium]
MPRSCLLLFAAFLLTTAAVRGGDLVGDAKVAPPPFPIWPQFRGPDGQGHVSEKIPTSWSDGDVTWKVPIPGKGWSSPIIAEGKIWMTTAVPNKGSAYTLRVVAVREDTGAPLHDIEVFSIPTKFKLHDRNTLATPTPVYDAGRLFVSFGTAGVAAIDTQAAKIVWKNQSLDLDYQTGAAASPIPYKDKILLSCDAADQQFAVALDKATGEIAWKTARPSDQKSPDSRRAFATPLVIHADGRDQVVMPASHCVYAYDPNDGKELWKVKYGGFSNVPRPVFAHGLVYVQTGFAPPELIAIRPDGTGDVTKSKVVWRYRKSVPNVPSPVVVGDHLYMVADNGLLTCLDARSGAAKWTQRLLAGNYSSSPLAQGTSIYVTSDDGKTTIFKAGDEYKEIARNELAAGKVQASPAVADGSLFIRTDASLIRVGR